MYPETFWQHVCFIACSDKTQKGKRTQNRQPQENESSLHAVPKCLHSFIFVTPQHHKLKLNIYELCNIWHSWTCTVERPVCSRKIIRHRRIMQATVSHFITTALIKPACRSCSIFPGSYSVRFKLYIEFQSFKKLKQHWIALKTNYMVHCFQWMTTLH